MDPFLAMVIELLMIAIGSGADRRFIKVSQLALLFPRWDNLWCLGIHLGIITSVPLVLFHIAAVICRYL